jgi:hypothetical protein
VVTIRPLALTVSLSVLAVGLFGMAAEHFEAARAPVSVREAQRAPEGARVLVRGLLEDMRAVEGGGAVSRLTDCANSNMTVFFEQAPPPSLAWRLVTLDARVASYKGSLELQVQGGARAEASSEAAEVVDADALALGWRAYLCRAVAVHAPVLSAASDPEAPFAVEIGIEAGGGALRVVAHSDIYLEVTLNPGADVTFVGVVGAGPDGRAPVLHVRV